MDDFLNHPKYDKLKYMLWYTNVSVLDVESKQEWFNTIFNKTDEVWDLCCKF